MWYVRKIDELLWKGKSEHDAVSISDLATQDNDISVWMDDGTDKLYIKLALAYTLETGQIRDMYCLRIPDEKVKEMELELNPISSKTPYIPMRDFHTNIVVKDLRQIGKLATIMHELIEKGQQINVSETELKECFYDAIKADEIIMDFDKAKNREYRKIITEYEARRNETVDFSKLKNVKDVSRINCPLCNGSRFVLEKDMDRYHKRLKKQQ